jgi:hypothetical protein
VSRPAEDTRFTFGLVWDVTEVLRRYGYAVPGHWGRYDQGDVHRRIGRALFRLIYTDTDLGTPPEPWPTPPVLAPGCCTKGVEL